MSQAAPPSIRRRLLCVGYEAMLLAAVLFVATFPFVAFTQALPDSLTRPLLQGYLVLAAGVYFSVFWRKGQTLAMKTWKIRLESRDGGKPTWKQAWLRYALACCLLTCLGVGWWAALFRADRQFLQDRLAGTRLVSTG